MVKRKAVSKESLKELCKAHSELAQVLKSHLTSSDNSRILKVMYENQIQEIEKKITEDLKTWVGI